MLRFLMIGENVHVVLTLFLECISFNGPVLHLVQYINGDEIKGHFAMEDYYGTQSLLFDLKMSPDICKPRSQDYLLYPGISSFAGNHH